jgi:sugar lactone lactonase YvrE
MDQSAAPELSFQSVKHGTWTVYNRGNSGLPHDWVSTIATDPDGSHWFGTAEGGAAHFDGTNWTVYDSTSSGLPDGKVYAIATDPDGSHWFGTDPGAAYYDGTNWTVYDSSNSGLPDNTVVSLATDPDGSHWFGTGLGTAHFDGTHWTVYNTSNSGLPGDYVEVIAIDPDGSHWFGTRGGAAHFDGTSWTVYDTYNSGLPGDDVWAIATDPDGSHWFGTDSGAAHFDGTNWTVYDSSSSGLPGDYVWAIATDPDGSHWFGTGNGAAHFDGTNWTVYNTSNSGLPVDYVRAIVADPDGSLWFGTSGGVAALWNQPDYPIGTGAQWLDDHTYHATYDITSLIPRGDYLVHVAGATGTDGIEIAPTVGYTFAVDYAGAIGDTTPPPAPTVLACGAGDPNTLSAEWYASDPESKITLHQYAIGSTRGRSDVINWTKTNKTSFNRTGLNLTSGQTYFVAVQSRNEGGLWSEAGVSSGVVAGTGDCPSAGFTADVARGTAPLTVQFTDQSIGNITGWSWDLGDDSTSSVQNPDHIYTEKGTYTVTLLVSGPGGSDLLARTGYITVLSATPSDRSVYLPMITE